MWDRSCGVPRRRYTSDRWHWYPLVPTYLRVRQSHLLGGESNTPLAPWDLSTRGHWCSFQVAGYDFSPRLYLYIINHLCVVFNSSQLNFHWNCKYYRPALRASYNSYSKSPISLLFVVMSSTAAYLIVWHNLRP